ncbi:MAG: mannose-1-phosphate guanylyltransferase [Chloroflexota bacterium]
MYVVILAGGSGTRLWPRSRRERPKHLLDLVTERTLLQETFDRVSSAVPASRILVVTEQSQSPLIRQQLPDVPGENVLIEPMRRGTGPAIGWAAEHIAKRDPNAVMAVFASDHVIVRRDEFLSLLLLAVEVAASNEALITFGIKPAKASTEFGYIHRGERFPGSDDREVYRVESFKEKPTAERAREFVESGEYYWNSGMFCWKASTVLREIEQQVPGLHRGLKHIADAIGQPNEQDVLNSVYPTLPRDTIDYAVMEKAANVLVIPADIGWSDVGTWSSLLEVLPSGENGNVVLGGTQVLAIDAYNTLVSSPHRFVALIGVEDLIIVDSDTALLVCTTERAADVKRIVEHLEANNLMEHL